jgi:hypothetical protein
VTLDGLGVDGQIGTTSRIGNYLGFPVGVSGADTLTGQARCWRWTSGWRDRML